MPPKMKKIEKYGTIGAVFLVVGALITIVWIQLISPLIASADTITAPLPPVVTEKVVFKSVPARITLPDIGIDLPITPGIYDPYTKTWTLDEQHVFANTLTSDGTISNDTSQAPLLLYGHNLDTVLGKTKNIQPGQILSITTADNERLDYVYIRDMTFEPNDTSILDYVGPEDVMVMTCTGAWDEKRRVMFFEIKL